MHVLLNNMLTLCIEAMSFMYIDSTYLQKYQEKGWVEYAKMTGFLNCLMF